MEQRHTQKTKMNNLQSTLRECEQQETLASLLLDRSSLEIHAYVALLLQEVVTRVVEDDTSDDGITLQGYDAC